MVYQWSAHGGTAGVPVQEAGEHLETLRERCGGLLLPDAVVEDARPVGSLLHPAFEWDDTAAAEAWRLEQARTLIRHIRVVLDTSPGIPSRARAFVAVQTVDGDRGYTSLRVAMAEPDMRQQVLARALAELSDFRRRYRSYQELAAVFEALDAVTGASAEAVAMPAA